MIPENDANKRAWPCIPERFFSDILVRAFVTSVIALIMLLIYPLFTKWGINDVQYLVFAAIAGLFILWLSFKCIDRFA